MNPPHKKTPKTDHHNARISSKRYVKTPRDAVAGLSPQDHGFECHTDRHRNVNQISEARKAAKMVEDRHIIEPMNILIMWIYITQIEDCEEK